MKDRITTLDGQEIQGLNVSIPRKHEMVQKIHTSATITTRAKKKARKKLAKIDSSDILDRTVAYCEACVPDYEAKRRAWLRLMEMKEELGV